MRGASNVGWPAYFVIQQPLPVLLLMVSAPTSALAPGHASIDPPDSMRYGRGFGFAHFPVNILFGVIYWRCPGAW